MNISAVFVGNTFRKVVIKIDMKEFILVKDLISVNCVPKNVLTNMVLLLMKEVILVKDHTNVRLAKKALFRQVICENM